MNSIYKVYNDIDIEILPCLFHLVQAWWRKANKLGLRKKEFIKNTQTIIINLEALPFMDYKNACKFYQTFKSYYNVKI